MEIERILYRDEKYLLTKVSVIAYFDNSSMARDAVSLLYDTEKGLKFKDGTGTPNNSVKMAIFAKMVSTVTMILTMHDGTDDGVQVVSKQPIGNMTVGGETLLKHGDLVDLNIDCSGSQPWLYCWQIKEKGYNITGEHGHDDTHDARWY